MTGIGLKIVVLSRQKRADSHRLREVTLILSFPTHAQVMAIGTAVLDCSEVIGIMIDEIETFECRDIK
jgi:hypothetical protein